MPESPPYQRPERPTVEKQVDQLSASTHPAAQQRLDTQAFSSQELGEPAGIQYAELHCKTNFSFLEGASHPDELVASAIAQGLSALAITDRNSLAGIVRAHSAARKSDLKLLIGAEIVPDRRSTGKVSHGSTADNLAAIVLLATNRKAYGNLSELITTGRRRAPKGECRILLKDIQRFQEGLLCCIPLSTESQRRHARTYETDCNTEVSPEQLKVYQTIFGDRCYALAELHHGPHDEQRLQRWIQLCESLNLPLAAANDVHYHEASRRPLHDVVTATRCNDSLPNLTGELHVNGERHLKSPTGMQAVFRNHDRLLQTTIEIADRCHFSLDELKYEYPEELIPEGTTAANHLKQLSWRGAKRRYPNGVPEKVIDLLKHELQLIAEMNYEAYFLTVYDIVRFARSRDILCQGRGSAANSVVCFCLGITSVDPSRIDVLFERFISKERDEAPDIDVDFEHERREEVLQYLYERYGRDRAGMTAALITYRPKSAIRDVARALGLSNDRIDKLASQLEHVDSEDMFAERIQAGGIDPNSVLGKRLIWLVKLLMGFPRHLSQHVGGMVVSHKPLCQLVPIENASMPGRTVIQWDKNDLETLGLLKIDCLSLGMLSAIRRCFEFIKQHHHQALTLANVPSEDPAVYDMMCAADTIGVFQIESRAQMSMLPRLRPHCFYDLVIEVAIVRPGPIQGDMVHPYLRRRSGDEPVEYPDPAVRSVLYKTLGVPIFQEQAMRLAIVAAGFSAGEADQLRRAMGKWRKAGVIEEFQQKLTHGMKERGYDEEFAGRVFKQICGFGEYGFPESHAASFALLVYISAWIKRYYPASFCASLINSQPMGFYAPAQLVRDAREHGIYIRSIDVNFSNWDCTLEDRNQPNTSSEAGLETAEGAPLKPSAFEHEESNHAIRLGFRLVRGFRAVDADTIQAARTSGGPFTSFEDLSRRTNLSRVILKQLAAADAFASLKINRRDALWKAMPTKTDMPLFKELTGTVSEEQNPELPTLSARDDVVQDYSTAGLSVKKHPVSFLRNQLTELRAITSADLADHPVDRRVKVAGLVLMRQRPQTAAGITFVTLEDETGVANLVVYPNVWQRFRQAARFSSVMMASGRLQREGDVIHVVCDRLDDVSDLLDKLGSRSRDFR
ncbi:MAG: error-prone DNA polymerase [Fuerstiella sp.]